MKTGPELVLPVFLPNKEGTLFYVAHALLEDVLARPSGRLNARPQLHRDSFLLYRLERAIGS